MRPEPPTWMSEAIPLPARIVALADDCEQLAGARRYNAGHGEPVVSQRLHPSEFRA